MAQQAQDTYGLPPLDPHMINTVDEQTRICDLMDKLQINEITSQLRVVDVVDSEGYYVGTVCYAGGPEAETMMSRALHLMIGDMPPTAH